MVEPPKSKSTQAGNLTTIPTLYVFLPPSRRTVKGGVVVEELSAGNGPEARRGKMVGMYYEGRLKGNNKKFDACQSGKPFKFRLGHGEVIKGWDLGVEGLKVGRVLSGYPILNVDCIENEFLLTELGIVFMGN